MSLSDISSIFPARYDSPSSIPIPIEIDTDERAISSLHFHEITWISSHNAGANNFAAGGDNIELKLATNQEYSIYKQLKYVGVRGLMLDIEYKNEGLMLVHGLVVFSDFESIINHEIIPFLEEDPDAIITIDLETLGDRGMIMKRLRTILANSPGLTSRIFNINDERWDHHQEWPTIQEMRDVDQRVIMLSDSSIVKSDQLGIMLRNSIVMENHWLGGFDECRPRNEYITNLDIPWHARQIWGKTWTRLFTINHFCCNTGIASKTRVNPNNIGGGDNGWGVLYPRVKLCEEQNGYNAKPNFIAVDWAHIGDAHEVADYLNFGGRLGTEQRCRSDQDCATDSCGFNQRCQCKLCDDNNCHSGCAIRETCVPSIEDTGANICKSNSTEIVIASMTSNAETISVQSSVLVMLQVIMILRMVLS